MRKESLNQIRQSPAGDVLQLQGSLTFRDWASVLPFSGRAVDLTQVTEVDSAGLGMLLCCAQRGQKITGCHATIRHCMKNGGLCTYCDPATRCVN